MGQSRTRQRNTFVGDTITTELQHLSVLVDTSTTPPTVLHVPHYSGAIYTESSQSETMTDWVDDVELNRTRVNPMTKEVRYINPSCKWRVGYPNFAAEPREEISVRMDIDGSTVGFVDTKFAELRSNVESEARDALWTGIPELWRDFERHKFDAAQFLGEFLDLKRIWVTALQRAKGDFWYWRDIYTRSRETWLEAQLALKPLVDDVIAATEAIAEFANRLDVVAPLVHKSYRSKREQKFAFTCTCIPYASSNGLRTEMEIRATCEAKYFAAYDPGHRIKAEGLTRMVDWLHRLNLHSTDVMVLWELLPWSFVIDYFLNIGDTLAMLKSEPPSGLVREGYSLNTVLELCPVGEPYQTEGYPLQDAVFGFKMKNTHYTRTPGAPAKPSVLDYLEISFWPGLTRATTTVLLVDPLARRAFRTARKRQEQAQRRLKRQERFWRHRQWSKGQRKPRK